ncbi:hypothetical protein MP228_012278 [Amoeboaphelidium protococcarum]|nr:hypothetical protein MP228_012278 [Amoeboaphelidium protococcarum]
MVERSDVELDNLGLTPQRYNENQLRQTSGMNDNKFAIASTSGSESRFTSSGAGNLNNHIVQIEEDADLRNDNEEYADMSHELLPSSRQDDQHNGIKTSANLKSKHRHKQCDRELCCCGATWLAVAMIIVLSLIALFNKDVGQLLERMQSQKVPIRSVILMISDGFGPSSETFARVYYKEYLQSINSTLLPLQQQQQQQGGKFGPFDAASLPLDKILVGQVRTHSEDTYVTDSAAAATAYSCGIRTNNHVIGMNAGLMPCMSLMELAHSNGYRTGLVATSRITHATPAAFYSHVRHRDMESEIARQLIQGLDGYNQTHVSSAVDLAFGGGYCHFYPNSSANSCRADATDLLQIAKDKGWQVGLDRKFFDSLSAMSQFPILNLFTPSHMSFDTDRNSSREPSLAEMTLKALTLLDADLLSRYSNSRSSSQFSGNGFFLKVEGSRIDMAAHANDPVGHVRDTIAYQEAVQVVQQYVDTHPGTVLISVSDHETGGLSVDAQLGEYPLYEFRPDNLLNVKYSTELLTLRLCDGYLQLLKQASSSADQASALGNYVYKFFVESLRLTPVPWFSDLSLSSKSGAWVDFSQDPKWNNPRFWNGTKPPPYFFTADDVKKTIKLMPTQSELERIFSQQAGSQQRQVDEQLVFNPTLDDPALLPIQYHLGDLLSKNAEVGWTTKGHTGADVNLYAYGHEDLFLKQEIDSLLDDQVGSKNVSSSYFPMTPDNEGDLDIPIQGVEEDDNSLVSDQNNTEIIEKRDWSFDPLSSQSSNMNASHRYSFPLLNTSFHQRINTSDIQLYKFDWWRQSANSSVKVWPGRPASVGNIDKKLQGSLENIDVHFWISQYLEL